MCLGLVFVELHFTVSPIECSSTRDKADSHRICTSAMIPEWQKSVSLPKPRYNLYISLAKSQGLAETKTIRMDL